jgi:hypothetical protein
MNNIYLKNMLLKLLPRESILQSSKIKKRGKNMSLYIKYGRKNLVTYKEKDSMEINKLLLLLKRNYFYFELKIL